jgi:hypothetical protein
VNHDFDTFDHFFDLRFDNAARLGEVAFGFGARLIRSDLLLNRSV